MCMLPPKHLTVNWGKRSGLESTSDCWDTGDKLGSQDCLLGNSRQDEGGGKDGNRWNKWHPACEYIKASLVSLHCAGDTWTAELKSGHLLSLPEVFWGLQRPVERLCSPSCSAIHLFSSDNKPLSLPLLKMTSNTDQGAQLSREEESSPLCYVTCAAVKHIQALYIYLWFGINLFLLPSLTWHVTSLPSFSVNILQIKCYLVLSFVSLFQTLMLSYFTCVSLSFFLSIKSTFFLLYHMLFNALSFISTVV